MRVLDLFSGIGGFSLGLERAGMETVAFVEIDEYCRKVLRKHWPEVPIYDDIKKVHGVNSHANGDGKSELSVNEGKGSRELVHGAACPSCLPAVDLVCGGFPCQPFSVAGKQRGDKDDRHLWPEMFRIIQEVRPTWVLGENVAGIIRLGLDEVLSDLESADYQTQTFFIPACAVDAPHRRDRVWIVGHSESRNGARRELLLRQGKMQLGGTSGRSRTQKKDVADAIDNGSYREGRDAPEPCGHGADDGIPFRRGSEDVADADRQRGRLRNPGWEYAEDAWEPSGRKEPGFWLPEPELGRVAHGVPRRVDRLRCLGNAVVPQVVEVIGRAILMADRQREED